MHDLAVGLHTLGLEDELGVPFSDVLIHHEQLEMPVRSVIVERSRGQELERHGLLLEQGLVGHGDLPVDVEGVRSCLSSILEDCSARSRQGLRLRRHDVSKPSIKDFVRLCDGGQLTRIRWRESST